MMVADPEQSSCPRQNATVQKPSAPQPVSLQPVPENAAAPQDSPPGSVPEHVHSSVTRMPGFAIMVVVVVVEVVVVVVDVVVVVVDVVVVLVVVVVVVVPRRGQPAGAGARRARNDVPSSFVMIPPKRPQKRTPPTSTIMPTAPCGTPPSG